ncbi:threonine ammonia-lyase IlvA [Nakamurella flavida]|uniref:L-threonine dehydratase n=1 Tax=Nakamurella flavida TaxID=363630 RepID=A0A939C5B6_9ACTN|nr:threonine ammonia-lyase IlvA [Nakamurella flavida]MBM9476684.1 threonine ammonia-lyase IlvA [Nakamurella flavida]MDP9778878.1 threonine dehydratase [Nakamurella flavida]
MTPPPALRAAAIDEAARRIDRVVVRTPLEPAPRLSALTGARVLLKREDLQVVRSYKVRGAYNLMSQLDEAQRASGVVCASAGNHAQGVAYACRALAVDGRIYLPRTTPRQKRDRIRAHGGDRVELIVVGDSFDDAAEHAAADALATGAVLVPPFDDLRTMAGQGTVAREILQQLGRPPDQLIVPVGGGGLLGGMAAYLAERAPAVALVAVEPAGAPSLAAALAAGRPVPLETTDPFVDGASVRTVGALPFAAIRAYGVTLRTVGEGAVCTGMLGLYQNEGIIAEPAGALAVTALLENEVVPGSTVVCVVSGGNNDVSRYGEILERSLVHQGLKHYFLVDFPQEPGALRRFLDEVLGPDDDVTLFEYVKRNNRETGPALVGIELGAAEGLPALLERMSASPMGCERIAPGSAAFRYLT